MRLPAVPSLQQLASGLPREVQTSLRAVLSSMDQFNRSVATGFSDITPGPWLRPQYSNSWVDFSTTRYVRYRREGVIVRMEGTMIAGVVGSAAFVLPLGYLPAQILNFPVLSNGAFGNINIAISGAVTLNVGSNAGGSNLNFSFAVA